ncbi:MAG: DUF882 domain-containing protein [Devosiaceae bacterium]|nr:DUF882 domain-containing protein [Devosiaceae bacterium]
MGKIVKSGVARHLLAAMLGVVALLPMTSVTTLTAASGERTLYLHYTHTNETKRITFRRNGRFDQAGLNDLTYFLRDWRRNEPTRMDPALFDLLWKVYQEVGATKPITVVSAYRSPQTNDMLRSRSNGVAKNSRHTLGMAIDFYIPGIAVSKLRESAMRHQVGGVGYYPTSGSPFVHLDTGNVRAWPRMTRNQLARLFPDGKTLHVASDGSVLSAAGRRFATAEWEKCRSVPCSGSNANTAPSRSEGRTGSGRTLLDVFFGNNENETTTVVADTAPARRTVTAVALVAPTPAPRANFLDARDEPVIAPAPLTMSPALFNTTHNISAPQPPSQLDPIVVASIPNQNSRPTPRVLLSNETAATSALLAAYAPVIEPEPDAQRALQMLIERRNGAPTPPSLPDAATLRGSIVTASLSPTPTRTQLLPPAPPLNQMDILFNGTFKAVAEAQPDNVSPETNIALAVLIKTSIAQDLPLTMRNIEFFAPQFEHSDSSLFTAPSISGTQFAVLYEPDESHFNPATELGPQSGQLTFTLPENQVLFSDRFTRVAPVIVAKT